MGVEQFFTLKKIALAGANYKNLPRNVTSVINIGYILRTIPIRGDIRKYLY